MTNNIEVIFKKLIVEGRLSHGYLFFGRPDLNFSVSLANFLENNKWTLPHAPLLDAHIISPDESGGIGIDTVKSASSFLWRTPFKSQYRTLIIDKADQLTPQSQNAILKISEEPPRQRLLLLLARDPQNLAAPLVSRLQKIFFCPPADKQREILPEAALFLKSGPGKRSDIIKAVVENDDLLEKFVAAVMGELDKDPVKNLKALKELSRRWSLISRYNTNKKLQLQAWAQSLSG